MTTMLTGKEVASALNEHTATAAAQLARAFRPPALATLRVGDDASQVAYERNASKRCAALGIACTQVVLPHDTTQDRLAHAIDRLNADDATDGILMLRPLPEGLDEKAACEEIAPAKDVDAATQQSLTRSYTGSEAGFMPCTAEAVMELLAHYGVDVAGKHAAVIGRSLVIGRAVAMLLLAADATPTICHTKTRNAPAITRAADIVVVACGRPDSFGAEYFSAGQIVVDVGTTWNAERKRLVGDVRFDEVAPLVSAITPVPGGVGAITTSVLARHVTLAARERWGGADSKSRR